MVLVIKNQLILYFIFSSFNDVQMKDNGFILAEDKHNACEDTSLLDDSILTKPECNAALMFSKGDKVLLFLMPVPEVSCFVWDCIKHRGINFAALTR